MAFMHLFADCVQVPFANNEAQGIERLKNILQPLLLRRTKETVDRDGNPIVVLPGRQVDVRYIDMTESEAEFYKALHNRSKSKFNEFQATGKVHSHLHLLVRMLVCAS
jgi:DNA repair protein RAD5